MRPNLVLALFALALTALSGCPEPSKRPFGSNCANDDECASGICGGNVCLDPALDTDGDGLINGVESELGSDPAEPDTDFDGIVDGEEITEGVQNVDTDGDGHADINESAVEDEDKDCITDQYDAEDTIPNSDLSPMLDVVCSFRGVCEGQRGSMSLVCEAGGARCVYDAVTGYENPEATCDGLDQNCDGANDDGLPDRDTDGVADCVDTDWDNDGVADATDTCPKLANPDQADADADGIGDACVASYTLSFVTSPDEVTAGVAFSASVTLLELGPSEGPVPVFTGTVTLALDDAGSGAALSGTTSVAAVAGTATFNDLVVDLSAPGLALTASAGDLGTARSPAFDAVSGAVTALTLEGLPAEATAGVGVGFEVVARDAFGKAVTDFTGTVTIESSDPGATLPAPYTFTTADAGRHTFAGAVFTSAGDQTLTVRSGTLEDAAEISVNHAAAAALRIEAAADAVAGVEVPLVVTALDAFGNTALDYAGTVTFTSTDAKADLPTATTFVAGDLGARTIPGFVPKTAGGQSISAADGAGLAGDWDLTVAHAAASRLAVSAPGTVASGAAFDVEVSAYDPFDNLATTYSGTVTATASDAGATLPAPFTYTVASAGRHTFTGFRLYAAGTQTLDFGDGLVSGFAQVAVAAGDAATVAISEAPSATTAGEAFVLTIELRDSAGNLAPDGPRTVTITTTDNGNPIVVQITTSVAVIGPITLTKAGDAVVTIQVGGLSDTLPIEVAPAATDELVLELPTSRLAEGQPFSGTLTAYDAFGNVATGYGGTVTFSTDDADGQVPSPATFTTTDAGRKVLAGFVARTAGRQTFTATDGTFTATDTVDVDCAAPATIELSGLATAATAGVALSTFTLTVRDPSGDACVPGNVTVTVTSSDPTVVPPGPFTLTPAGGGSTQVPAITFKTAGNQTLTFTTTGATTTSTLDVAPAAATALEVVLADESLPAGVATSATVTARDAFGNRARGYRGAVAFTSNDAEATLPAPTTFVEADAGRRTVSNIVFRTVGARSFTATDTQTSSVTGSDTLTVTQGADIRYVLSGVPTTQTAGVAFGLTLEVQDLFGNRITNYTGTVRFTSDDPIATLPANFTFTASDAGRRAFTGVQLKTAQSTTLRLTDTGNAAVTASAVIDVTPAAMASLELTCSAATVVSGGTFACNVRARDVYGNRATGYRGTVGFSSSDPNANLSAPYAFTASDNGERSFSGLSLKRAGTQTVTVADGAVSDTETFTVQPGAASTYVVTGLATNVTAGAAQTLTATAYDAQGNVATGYTGTASVSSTDPAATFSTPIAFTAGVASFSITFKTAGDRSVSLNGGGSLGATGSTRVGPAVAKTLELSALPTSVTAGVATSVTATVRDEFGNVATGFTGTATLSSTDTTAVFAPTSLAFTAGDAGAKSFTVTFKKKGAQSVTANAGTGLTASRSTTVNPAAAARLAVTGLPASVTAGAGQSLTATVYDAFDNVADFNGAADVTSSDAQVQVTTPITLASGVRTFSASLRTAGAQSITVNAGGALAATVNTTVTPAAGAKLALSSLPTTVTAGTAQPLTVTVRDAYDNRATGYTGTVNLSTTDAAATLTPSSLVFAAADQGQKSFTATFATAGAQSVSATNALGTATTSTTVNPSSTATQIDLSALPATTVAGTTRALTVTLKDQFGNVVTNYSGTVGFSVDANESQATISPTTLVFNGTQGGVGNVTVTFRTAGNRSLTATAGNLNDTSTTAVSAADASKIELSGPSSATAGAALSVTATVRDAFNNVATGYRGSVRFTSNDTHAAPYTPVLPANYTFTASDNGVRTFTNGVTLYTAGARTVTVTDLATSTITATQALTLGPATAAKLALTGPSTGTAGTAFTTTITVRDLYDNVATGYRGTVAFTTNDTHAAPFTPVLPANTTFTATDNGVRTFTNGTTLYTAGARTVTATDTTNASLTSTLSVALAPLTTASRLRFAVQPPTGTAGVALSPAPSVELLDLYDNRLAGSGVSVSLALATNPGRALMTGGTATTASGLATFSALQLDRPGAGYRVRATVTGLTAVTSNTFDVAWQAPTVGSVTTVQQSTRCVDVTYQASHNLAPVDVDVEYDIIGDSPDLGWRDATQAGASRPVSSTDPWGANDVPVGTTATSRVFRWNALADLGAFDAVAYRVRVTASVGTSSASKESNQATFDATWSYDKNPGSSPYPLIDSKLADLNRDGHLDLVAVAQGTDLVIVHLGNGTGNYGTAQTFKLDKAPGIDPYRLAVADTKADGSPDVIVADAKQDRVVIAEFALNTNGALVLANQNTLGQVCGLDPYVQDIAVLNTDNTTPPELVMACAGAKKVTVYAFNGDTYGNTYFSNTPAAPYSLRLADLDWSGSQEILVGLDAGLVAIFNQAYREPDLVDLGSALAVVDLDVGDLDRDGQPDLVAAVADVSTEPFVGEKAYPVLFGAIVRDDKNLPLQYFDPASLKYLDVGGGVTQIELADLDRDGWLDLLGAMPQDDYLVMARSRDYRNGALVVDLVNIIVGTAGPDALSVGDLDHDGWLDLVATRRSSTSEGRHLAVVTTPRSDCDVTWSGSGEAPSMFDELSTTVLEDMDRDGRLDLVHANGGLYGVGGAQIVYGRGNGRFEPTPVTIFTSQLRTEQVAAGDVNNDGKTDLVALDGSKVVVYTQTSPTAFTLASVGTFAASSSDLVVEDLNLDRRDDIAYLESSPDGPSKLHIYLQQANGTFTAAATTAIAMGNWTTGLAVADINSDGGLDFGFVTTIDGSDYASLCTLSWLGGTSWESSLKACAQLEYGGSPLYTTVTGGFVKLDTTTELAYVLDVLYLQSSTTQIRRQSDPGLFDKVEDDGNAATVPPGYAFCPNVNGMTFGEFNNNATGLDLALRCYAAAGQVHVFYRGTGAYDASRPIVFGGQNSNGDLVGGDLNGDQRDDLVNGTTTYPHAANVNGGFQTLPGRLVGSGDGPTYDLEVADLNGDGFPDAVGSDGYQARVYPTIQKVTGSFASPVFVNPGYAPRTEVASGDFDGDHRPDLTFGFVFSSTTLIRALRLLVQESFSFDGTTFAQSSLSLGSTSPQYDASIEVGDFDSNGLDDIAVLTDGSTDVNDDRVAIRYQSTPGVFPTTATTTSLNDTFNGGTAQIAAGRLRAVSSTSYRDQGVAAAGVCRASGRSCLKVLGLFASAGAGPYVAATFTGTPKDDYWIVDIAVGDLNADGRDDIVLIQDSPNGPLVNLWIQSATGSFSELQTSYVFSGYLRQIELADVNRDGLLDLAALVYRSSEGGQADALEVMLNTTTTGVSFSPATRLESTGWGSELLRATDLHKTGRPALVTVDPWTDLLRAKR